MPIRYPERYPIDWQEISLLIRESNGWCCQACGKQCTRPGEAYAGARYVLTVAHYDPFSYEADWAQVIPLCAPCHLRLDAEWSWYFRRRNERWRQRQAGQLFLELGVADATERGGTGALVGAES